MLVAAAVCPHPPLIVPDVAAGAAAELDSLRAACDRAVRGLLDTIPDVVAVVGHAPVSGHLAGSGGTLAPYGVPVRTGSGAPTLPLPHTIGAWLLDRAGYAGARTYWGVTGGTADAEVASEVAGAGRVAVLAMGDGSARRTEKAPGHLDPRAADFDAAVVSALRSGPDAVRTLDGVLAHDLLADGWPAWQLLASTASGRPVRCDVLYADAPYGVGYFVATWSVS